MRARWIVVGIGGAFLLAQQIASLLYGVTAWDPVVFGLIPVVLLATAALAVWWPAGKATQVDPATALRES